MSDSTAFRPSFARHLRTAFATVVICASLLGLGLLGLEVSDQIDLQSSASSDNLQWALSQVDVELLHLGIALDDASHDPAKLDTARTRFDVFFSRVQMLDVGSVFALLRKNADLTRSFSRLKTFVDETAPMIDRPDAEVLAGLDPLKAKVRALLPDAHQVALVGVGIFAVEADVQRAAVKQTLIQMAGLTLVLFVALLVMLGRVLRLDRGNRIKALENAETLARLDAVVAASLDPVITLDDAGAIVDFNPAASQTFGFSKAEASGQGLGLIMPKEAHGQSLLPDLSESLTKGRKRLRITARHRDGHEKPAELSVSMAQAGGRSLQVVFLRDLSQQVAAEQALVAARDDALAGEKAKADLLVVMSHEIRTPLNGMIGTIDLLEATDLAPHQREYLRIMAASGRLLMHHVNDVLDIARLDSGKAILNLAPVDLAALTGEVLENQRSASLAQGNRLTFVHPPDGRNLVQSDASLLRQVLMNLVGNAVKFTHDGEISVSITHLSARGPTEIVVRDTGVGIASEDLGRIFEDFVTLDASYARRSSGTGLGLGIVRRIVTQMGGQIRVESDLGVGSSFRVTLQMTILDKVTRASAPTVSPRPKGGQMSVLVVEDNDFNRLIVHDMLVQEGHGVATAPDGLQGVKLAQDQRYDVILMDVSMPGIDGLQAAERIRQGKGASRAARIIALTAHALPGEAERFRARGLQGVLVKPLTRDMLRAVLSDTDVPRSAVPERLINTDILEGLVRTIGAAKAEGLIARFLTETEQRLAKMMETAGSADQEAELVGEVHQMSGTAAMFGAAALHEWLSRMEDLCKRGEKAAARAELPGLSALWQRTAAAFRDRAYRSGGDLLQASSLR